GSIIMRANANVTTQYRINDVLYTALGKTINDILADEAVIEIMLNPDGRIWVERLGEEMKDSGHIMPSGDAERVIRLVASSENRECNELKPSLAAILPQCGSRFQGFMPPIVQRPCFTIRKK